MEKEKTATVKKLEASLRILRREIWALPEGDQVLMTEEIIRIKKLLLRLIRGK